MLKNELPDRRERGRPQREAVVVVKEDKLRRMLAIG